MAKPIENNDNAKAFWGNLSDANPLDEGIKIDLRSLLDAEKSGAAAQLNPPGMARMVSVEVSEYVSFQVKSTTGYIATRDWAGAVTVFGTGVPANYITAYFAIPASGAWSKSAPKEIYVWSCTAGNATQSGNLTALSCYGDALTSLDVSGLIAMQELQCSGNALTSLNLSGLTALTLLSCSFNNLVALDVSGLLALSNLNCSGNALTSLNAGGFTGAASKGWITVDGNQLSASALNAFYSSLGTADGYKNLIDVSSNPGAMGSDYTIATAKGWAVTGI